MTTIKRMAVFETAFRLLNVKLLFKKKLTIAPMELPMKVEIQYDKWNACKRRYMTDNPTIVFKIPTMTKRIKEYFIPAPNDQLPLLFADWFD